MYLTRMNASNRRMCISIQWCSTLAPTLGLRGSSWIEWSVRVFSPARSRSKSYTRSSCVMHAWKKPVRMNIICFCFVKRRVFCEPRPRRIQAHIRTHTHTYMIIVHTYTHAYIHTYIHQTRSAENFGRPVPDSLKFRKHTHTKHTHIACMRTWSTLYTRICVHAYTHAHACSGRNSQQSSWRKPFDGSSKLHRHTLE